MQTAFEVLFILAFALPPLAVACGIAAVMLGRRSVDWRSHAWVRRYRPVRG